MVASPSSRDDQVPKEVLGFGRALLEAAETRDTSRGPAPSSCYQWQGTPTLDIEEYVLRLHRLCGYSHYSQDIFVLAFVYITKAVELNPGRVGVSRETVHRLALVATLVAAKYHEGVPFRSNELYAQAGNVEVD